MSSALPDDRYLLISADGHTGPPAEHYREYLDEQYHPQFDAHQAELGVIREFQQSMNQDFRKEWEAKTGDGGLHAAYDSDARNERLDGEGVAASPFGSGLGNPTGCDPELVFAGARAHNRWLADFSAKEPHRRIGVAVVPIVVDVDAAVTEIHEVADRGLRGVMIP
ncbi:MAG TPA: amidohydrolase, partial [Acidimicrobiales bacterium]